MSIKSGFTRVAIMADSRMGSISLPNIWIPIGLSYSKISSFFILLAAERISPSEEMNSVYIMSAPLALHTARNGGSLTSSMGASRSGNSPSSIFLIFTNLSLLPYRVQNYALAMTKVINLRERLTAGQIISQLILILVLAVVINFFMTLLGFFVG